MAIDVVTPRPMQSAQRLLKVRRTPFWLDEDRVFAGGIAVTSFHSGRKKWDRDRERRNALTAMGWTVLHVTSTMLEDQRDDFVRDLERSYGPL